MSFQSTKTAVIPYYRRRLAAHIYRYERLVKYIHFIYSGKSVMLRTYNHYLDFGKYGDS